MGRGACRGGHRCGSGSRPSREDLGNPDKHRESGSAPVSLPRPPREGPPLQLWPCLSALKPRGSIPKLLHGCLPVRNKKPSRARDSVSLEQGAQPAQLPRPQGSSPAPPKSQAMVLGGVSWHPGIPRTLLVTVGPNPDRWYPGSPGSLPGQDAQRGFVLWLSVHN